MDRARGPLGWALGLHPPGHVAPPEVKDATWPRNAIDRFVLNRIEKEGLSPSPEADRATLIRRLSLDLTGLPPTPAEVDAFLADTGPAAYEKVVDRLLASPHYGERMAQDWLDLARYADTNGYHIDNNRDIWMYRDWVIEAFNRNQPFDQFTVEQVAGDLLPNPTVAQRIATGFQRNTMVNFEGGADADEYLTKYVVDRVNTTAAVYLGTTLACAECHDHKYDPFTQKDFYRFYAFFNTIDEKGLDGLKESPAPRLKVPTAEQDARLKEVRGQISRLDDLLKGPLPSVDAAQAKWERDQAEIRKEPTLGWKVLEPSDLVSQNDAMLTKLDDHSVLAGGANPDADVFEVTAPTTAKAITAIRLEALTHESLAHKGAARSENGNFVLTGFEVEAVPASGAEPSRKVVFSRAEADHSQDEKGFHVSKAIDGDPKSGWAVSGDKKRVDRRAVFVADAPFGFESGTTLKIRLRFESGLAEHVIGRFRLAFTTAKAPSLNLVPPPKIAALLETPEAERTEAQVKEIREYYRGTLSAEIRPFRDELAALRKAEGAIDRAIPTTMVMKEQEKPRETHILMRGDFRSKGEVVTPDVPQSLPRIPEGQPANRLGLARWLVDPGHPLVARVTVNRFWQHYFGVGLVKTSDDFGTQGEWPSHPDLLDWLATEFIASGWDVKALQKQIVMSATYRQSSKLDPVEARARPREPTAARGPRFRLDAETIRDNALAVSGLLNPRMGGPSIFPYQPPGLWEELAFGGDFTSQSLHDQQGRRPLPPRPLHVLEALPAEPLPDGLRRPQPRALHRPAAPDEHAAASPGPAQRPGLHRDRPGPGAADDEGRGLDPARSPRLRLPALHGADAERPRARRLAAALSSAARQLPEGPEGRRGPDPGRGIAAARRPRRRGARRLDGRRQHPPEPRRDHHEGLSHGLPGRAEPGHHAQAVPRPIDHRHRGHGPGVAPE